MQVSMQDWRQQLIPMLDWGRVPSCLPLGLVKWGSPLLDLITLKTHTQNRGGGQGGGGSTWLEMPETSRPLRTALRKARKMD